MSVNRREFLASLAIGSLTHASRQGLPAKKRLAITMDDPHRDETPLLSPQERNTAILEALERASLKAALFVCGRRVDSWEGFRLLHKWEERGHLLGNHTYSHPYLPSPKVSPFSFCNDICCCREVLDQFERPERLFRYPYLKEGDTVEKRDAVRSFLSERDYRVGHVTIDASDWYVDMRMAKRLEKDPSCDLSPYRDFYLKHLWERATFYDDLAVRVLGRTIPHTLLIHHSLLNALFLEDVLHMFQENGWELVDAKKVYADEVFSESPDILPAGESLVWALAKQTGRFEEMLRYPGEDGVYEEAAMDRRGL